MNRSIISKLTLSAVLLGSCALAQAQWVWLNDKGVKQFSDQPPPPNVPIKNIVKAPRGQVIDLRKELNAPDEEKPATAAPKAAAKPPTLAERNEDYAKRQKASAESAQKSAEESQLAAAKKQDCQNARDNLRLLESGERVSDVSASGERGFMSDEKRAARAQQDKSYISKNCQ